MNSPSPVEDNNPRGFNARFDRALIRLLVRLKVQDVPHLKRIIVTVVGGTILLIGAALIVLPGQVLIMLAGLAILATEYAWARRLLSKSRQLASKALSQTQSIVTRRAVKDDGRIGADTTPAQSPMASSAALDPAVPHHEILK